MKTQIFEYLEAAHNRRETRMHKRWQRIRRIGQRRFILLFISGFWLFMAAVFFYAAWTILPSFEALNRLPDCFYRQLMVLVPTYSILLYFGARYTWRQNERKYANDRNA